MTDMQAKCLQHCHKTLFKRVHFIGRGVFGANFSRGITNARPLPMKLKLALAGSMLFALGIGILSLYVSSRLQHDFEGMVAHQQKTAVDFVARSLDRELQLRINALEALARQISRQDQSNHNPGSHLPEHPVAATIFSRDLYIISTAGIRIAEAPFRNNLGTDYNKTPYFQRVMSTGKPTVMALLGRFAKQPVIVIAAPIIDDKGEILGVLCGSELIVPGSPFHFSGIVRNGEYGGFHVFDQTDKIIAVSTDPERVLQPIPPTGRNPLLDRRLAGYLGPGQTIDSKGVEIFSVANKVAAADWLVVAYLPTDEAFAPIRNLKERIYLGSLVLVILIGIVTWLLLRRELNPLEAAAKWIASGKPDDIPSLPVGGSSEIRFLLENFNRLLARIREQNDEIVQERDHLERNVEERTRSLTLLNASLDNQSKLYRDLYDNAPCGYHSLNEAGVIVEVNDTELRMLGYCREEYVGQPISKFMPPEGAETFRRHFPDFLRSGQIRDLDIDYLRKDGSICPCIVSADGVRDATGAIVFTRSTLIDNTERQAKARELAAIQEQMRLRAEEAEAASLQLSEQQRFIRTITDAVPSVIGYWDSELHNRFANKAYLRWFGKTPDEMARIHISDLLSEALFKANEPMMRQALSGTAVHFERELPIPDGSETRHALIDYIPDIVDGSVKGFFVLITDISENRRWELQLESLNAELARRADEAEAATRAKSTFLANMSHEIRTPMNGILGMAHILRRGSLSPHQADQLDKIIGSGKHLLGVINDILDISKIEAGKLTLDETDFVLDDVLRAAIAVIEESIRTKGLRLVVETDGIPRHLHGDPTRLTQCLVNYLSNALKFTPAGVITLRGSLLEDAGNSYLLRFAVTDTGVGMDPSELERLFVSFQQADNSVTRRFGGTGLGLAITKHIAKMMKGDVGASSEKGKGSTFWIAVRLGKSKMPETRSDDRPANAEATLQREHLGKRILLVEDEPINQEIAVMFLEQAGLQVDLATTGSQAVRRVGEAHYDAILMDLQMPEMGGLEATREIRRIGGRQGIPIIAMTANAFADDREQCMAAGMNDFISKPFNPDLLMETVLKWLAR